MNTTMFFFLSPPWPEWGSLEIFGFQTAGGTVDFPCSRQPSSTFASFVYWLEVPDSFPAPPAVKDRPSWKEAYWGLLGEVTLLGKWGLHKVKSPYFLLGMMLMWGLTTCSYCSLSATMREEIPNKPMMKSRLGASTAFLRPWGRNH